MESRDVLGKEVTGKSDFGVVRSGNDFLLSLEAVESGERTYDVARESQ